MPLPFESRRYNTNNEPGLAHALTFSCYKRHPFLKSRIAREYVAESINHARLLHEFEVWAYVLMPEHVHLLIFPKNEEYSISNIVKSIKQTSSKRLIQFLKENNPEALKLLETGLEKPRYKFWQRRRGFDRDLGSPEAIRKNIDYIHDNPVKRGLVENPEDWAWSSARYWLLEEEGPVVVERDHLVLF